MDLKKVIEQAKKELDEELFRKAVDVKKIELKTKKSLIDKLFPYKIIIVKKK